MRSFITTLKYEDMIEYTIESISILRPSSIKWNGGSTDYYDGEICLKTDKQDIYATYRCKKTGEYGSLGIITECEGNVIEIEDIKDLKIESIERIVVMEELLFNLGIKDYEYYRIVDQHNQIYLFNVENFFTYNDTKYIKNEL